MSICWDGTVPSHKLVGLLPREQRCQAMISSLHDNASIISSKKAVPLSNYCITGCYHGLLRAWLNLLKMMCQEKNTMNHTSQQSSQCSIIFWLPGRQAALLQGYENSSVVLRVSKKDLSRPKLPGGVCETDSTMAPSSEWSEMTVTEPVWELFSQIWQLSQEKNRIALCYPPQGKIEAPDLILPAE